MKYGAQKRKEKVQQQFQSSAAKSRQPTKFVAASITPTNNYLAEKACDVNTCSSSYWKVHIYD